LYINTNQGQVRASAADGGRRCGRNDARVTARSPEDGLNMHRGSAKNGPKALGQKSEWTEDRQESVSNGVYAGLGILSIPTN
jgi:hypothetical protein